MYHVMVRSRLCCRLCSEIKYLCDCLVLLVYLRAGWPGG